MVNKRIARNCAAEAENNYEGTALSDGDQRMVLLTNAHTLRALRSLVDLDEHDSVHGMNRVGLLDLKFSSGQDGRNIQLMECE